MKELILNCSLNSRRGGGGEGALGFLACGVLCRFSIRCPGSGVVLDCIDS